MLAMIVAALGLLAAQPSAASSVPMQLVNNHVVVSVRLDGAGPFRFIVDSGAGNLIDPAIAAAIGARVRGHVRLVGVGDTTQAGGVTTVHRVDIGTATFVEQRFVVAAVRSTFAAAEGPVLDGLIGQPIIGAGITVFDYAHRSLTFNAGDEVLRGAGSVDLPVAPIEGELQVRCTIADVEGSCAIDTGSRLDLTLTEPFTREHPEVLPASLSAIGIDGFGIGGAAYGRLGRLPDVSFGSLLVRDVVADCSVQRHGAFASARIAANIGGGLLRRFTVAFDLAHHRIVLRPNEDFDVPSAVDRSGLFLIIKQGAVAVLDVRPQTPAARAGIVAGDVILRVRGQAAEPETLPELRELFEGPAQTHVELTIAGADDSIRTVDLTLADYL